MPLFPVDMQMQWIFVLKKGGSGPPGSAYVHDGLIFKTERVIVPQGMRKEIKQRLHLSHLGADSVVRRVRDYLLWPGISADIKQTNYPTTQKHAPADRSTTSLGKGGN